MTGKWAEVMRLMTIQCHPAVGDPDAFPIEIHGADSGVVDDIFRPSAGEKRPVKHGQFRVPGWIGNGDGEEAGIFVVHIGDFDAVIPAIGCEPQTLPVEEILSIRQRRSADPLASTPCRSSRSVGAVPRR